MTGKTHGIVAVTGVLTYPFVAGRLNSALTTATEHSNALLRLVNKVFPMGLHIPVVEGSHALAWGTLILAAILAGAVASLPDAAELGQTVSWMRFLPIINIRSTWNPFYWFRRHRWITHSVFFLAGILWLVYSQIGMNVVTIAVGWGILSHLLADSLTDERWKPLVPFADLKIGLPLIRTGGTGELLFRHALVLWSTFMVYMNFVSPTVTQVVELTHR